MSLEHGIRGTRKTPVEKKRPLWTVWSVGVREGGSHAYAVPLSTTRSLPVDMFMIWGIKRLNMCTE